LLQTLIDAGKALLKNRFQRHQRLLVACGRETAIAFDVIATIKVDQSAHEKVYH
jgi:hypothetical protein